MVSSDLNPGMPNKSWISIDVLIQKIKEFYWPYQLNKMMWTTRRFCMVSLWKTSNYLISNVDWVLNKCKFCTFLSPQNSFFCISLSLLKSALSSITAMSWFFLIQSSKKWHFIAQVETVSFLHSIHTTREVANNQILWVVWGPDGYSHVPITRHSMAIWHPPFIWPNTFTKGETW